MTAGESEYTIDLGGRTALVTGGGNGVGAEIVSAFVRAGASVWVNDIYEERAQAVADSVSGPGDARPVKADVTSPVKVRRMREDTGPVEAGALLVDVAPSHEEMVGVRAVRDGRVLHTVR